MVQVKTQTPGYDARRLCAKEEEESSGNYSMPVAAMEAYNLLNLL